MVVCVCGSVCVGRGGGCPCSMCVSSGRVGCLLCLRGLERE